MVMVTRQSSTGGGKWSGVKSPELPVWPPPSASTTTTSTRSTTSTSASSTSSTSASQRRGTPDARVHLPLTGSVHTLERSPSPVSSDPACPAATKESQFFSYYVNLLCKSNPILDKKDCDPHLINMQHNVTGLSYPCLPNSEYMEVPLESGLNQEALFPQM